MDPKKSECVGGWMHRYEITRVFTHGVEERCRICKDKQFFNNDIPNYEYLAFHLRSALQSNNKRFNKEYRK